MRTLLAAVILWPVSVGIAGTADTVAACQARQVEIARRVDQYKGDPVMKKLLQADLQRATTELMEGDAGECMEALDHADKLLSGNI